MFCLNYPRKNLYRASYVSMVAVLLLLTGAPNPVKGLERRHPSSEIKVVWADDRGQGEQIYFSSYDNILWEEPVQLSYNKEMPFHPAVASGNDGKIWATWSQLETNGSSLQFSVFDTPKWSTPRQLNTGLRANTSASIIADSTNMPVIVWSGTDKVYPDIFWSRWNGENWNPVKKVHADNDVPDLQPILKLDFSGNTVLSWQAFEDGKYVTVNRTLKHEEWIALPDTPGLGQRVPRESFSLPGFIQDKRKATIFIRDANGARSIGPLR